jgi:hypothetical protein
LSVGVKSVSIHAVFDPLFIQYIIFRFWILFKTIIEDINKKWRFDMFFSVRLQNRQGSNRFHVERMRLCRAEFKGGEFKD